MSNKIYFKIFPFFVIFLLLSKNVYAQDAASDQYKQMGGVTGLTEICFKTKNLELTLLKQIGHRYVEGSFGETSPQIIALEDDMAVCLGGESELLEIGDVRQYVQPIFQALGGR